MVFINHFGSAALFSVTTNDGIPHATKFFNNVSIIMFFGHVMYSYLFFCWPDKLISQRCTAFEQQTMLSNMVTFSRKTPPPPSTDKPISCIDLPVEKSHVLFVSGLCGVLSDCLLLACDALNLTR